MSNDRTRNNLFLMYISGRVDMQRAGLQLLLLVVALAVDVCKFLTKFYDCIRV